MCIWIILNTGEYMNWVEKYRPKTLADVVGQDRVIRYLSSCRDNGREFNHMVFYGKTSGIGKTSTARALAYELGVDFLEFNASDDRTLSFIRKTIINAMRYSPFTGGFKLIFLDETESLLNDAMFALRSPLEKYFSNCRIIFGCNDKSNIDKAIISRCIVFQFVPISKETLVKRLRHIAEKESLTVDNRILDQISDKAKGDLRKAINWLQVYKNNGWDTGGSELQEIFNKY